MSTIKAIIFDMDGVLIDAQEWHYEALNQALALFGETIAREEHTSLFDGLSTKAKLAMLSSSGRIPKRLHKCINALKQKFIMELVATRCHPVFTHQHTLSRLKADGYQIAVASNSIRNTVTIMMERSGLMPYLSFYLSNEDVTHPKPNPEIYQMAIKTLGLRPDEVVIVEDNDYGLQAARASGGHTLQVTSTMDVTYANITAFIQTCEEALC